MVASKRQKTGAVSSYAGSYGYLTTDDGAIFFVHQSEIEGAGETPSCLAVGDEVAFDVAANSEYEDVAVNVVVVKRAEKTPPPSKTAGESGPS